MYLRISSVAGLALALAACGGVADKTNVDPMAQAEADADKTAADDGRIACAVSGATVFSRVCQIEQSQSEAGLLLTIRHPDGGFRRLQVTKDGRGVVAADGAETAKVTPIGPKEIEVVVAGNRYRLPATVKGAASPSAAPAAIQPAKP
jgi:hypothetical protein